MKIIEKITLILYSNIILIMSVILCLLVFGWLDANVVANLAKALLIGEKSSGDSGRKSYLCQGRSTGRTYGR